MNRSLWLRGLVMVASTFLFVMGCGSEDPTTGDLPATKVATPEDMDKLQKELLQKKVAGGATYKAPPNVNMPKK